MRRVALMRDRLPGAGDADDIVGLERCVHHGGDGRGRRRHGIRGAPWAQLARLLGWPYTLSVAMG